MTQFFAHNRGPAAISILAVAGYCAYVSGPTDKALSSMYSHYIAAYVRTEEPRARYFDEGIEIKFDREAPPVAALEEALRDQPWATIDRSPSFSVPATELKPIAKSVERIATRILAENQRDWAEIRSLPASVTTATLSNGLHQSDLNQQSSGSTSIIQNRRPLSNRVDAARIAALPPVPSEDLLHAAEAVHPTKTVRISAVKRDQLLASLMLSIQPMQQNGQAPNQPSAPGRRFVNPSAHEGSSLDRRDRIVAQNEAPSQPMGFMDTASGRLAPQGRQILVRGPIEFEGGLAVTHSGDRLVVNREADGRSNESGSVSMREARYEIYVESMEGHLVAELRSPHGEVVGRGIFELGKIQMSNDQRRVENVLLKVSPVTTGLVGHVKSGYSMGPVDRTIRGARVEVQDTPMKTATKAAGLFEVRRLEEGSRVLTRITTKDHRPSVATLIAGRDETIPVFSNKMINAFEGLTESFMDTGASSVTSRQSSEGRGLIWGRVVRNGQPVEGARIDVLTEGAFTPIYFSEFMLPDKSRTTTSSNGLFAVSVERGELHSMQVSLGKFNSDPVFVAVEPKSVSPVDLDLSKETVFPARAFDAFRTDWSLAVDVRPLGHARGRTIRMLREPTPERPHQVRLRHLGHPSFFDVEAGPEYVTTRITQNPETRYMIMPLVQKSWFDRTVGRLRFNPGAGEGSIIGFIQGSRFKVSMVAEALGPEAKIVYFDSRGELLPTSYGEPGGGFLILGAREGLQTVMIEADGSDHVFAATALVERETLATLSHWLR